MSIGSIIIAHQIGRRRCPGEGLSDLSGQPLALNRRWLGAASATDMRKDQSPP
jgi:hypothetical protein